MSQPPLTSSQPEAPARGVGAPVWPRDERPVGPRDEPPLTPLSGPPPSGPPTRRGPGQRFDWLAVGLAVLIAFTSIMSAVVAWRASVAAIDASRLSSLVVQQGARRQQIERQIESMVAQDRRFAGAYLEHALAARELTRQAEELRATDPAGADALDLLAHGQRALARSLAPFFNAGGISLADDGSVDYDEQYVLDFLRDANPELRALDPEATLEAADRADQRTTALIGVAAVLVAALLLLTIGQVIRRRRSLRSGFAASGSLLAGAATVGLLVVEFVWR